MLRKDTNTTPTESVEEPLSRRDALFVEVGSIRLVGATAILGIFTSVFTLFCLQSQPARVLEMGSLVAYAVSLYFGIIAQSKLAWSLFKTGSYTDAWKAYRFEIGLQVALTGIGALLFLLGVVTGK